MVEGQLLGPGLKQSAKGRCWDLITSGVTY